ncbi:MAG TPA: DUF401 family protein, partial [Limnochordia bacterium]|nr:DUF401 family protein [Limnochordia bacterium]
MAVLGVAVAFGSVIYLASKGIALWLALLMGTGMLGFLSQMGLIPFASVLLEGLISPLTIQLVLAVALISGLSRVLKENGDLELLVGSLIALVPRPKALTMLLPALIGMINVPGGAIMSAPMVEENGKTLALDTVTQSAVNLFFRHIGYFIYPLHTSLILLSELLSVPKPSIILYNLLPTLVGAAAAYLTFFPRSAAPHKPASREQGTFVCIKQFLLGFSSILLILGLVLLFQVPFYLAAAAGLCLALVRNLQGESKTTAFLQRLQHLFTKGIDYKLTLAILALMLFKTVVEASGVTTTLTEAFLSYGIPLPILVVVLGALASYILGAHMAASGLLAPFFASLIPASALAPYTA